MGPHLTEIFAGLITFQRHLEHESLVHYDSGTLVGIVRHQCFLNHPSLWSSEKKRTLKALNHTLHKDTSRFLNVTYYLMYGNTECS